MIKNRIAVYLRLGLDVYDTVSAITALAERM